MCKMQIDFWRCLRPTTTATRTHTPNLWCECVCVCIRAVLWWAMEVSPATACGCVPLWCWQGEGGYGIGAATAVFQTAAGAVSPLRSLCLPLYLSLFLPPNSLFLFPHPPLGSPPTCISNSHVWIGTLYIVDLKIIVSDFDIFFLFFKLTRKRKDYQTCQSWSQGGYQAAAI